MTIMMSCLSKIRERLTETPRRCGKPPYNGTSADHCSRPHRLIFLCTFQRLLISKAFLFHLICRLIYRLFSSPMQLKKPIAVIYARYIISYYISYCDTPEGNSVYSLAELVEGRFCLWRWSITPCPSYLLISSIYLHRVLITESRPF